METRDQQSGKFLRQIWPLMAISLGVAFFSMTERKGQLPAKAMQQGIVQVAQLPEEKAHKKTGKWACMINCMDGRVQDVVEYYIKKTYKVDHVDAPNMAGPSKLLAENPKEGPNKVLLDYLRQEIEISKEHGAIVFAVVAHAECAGNPAEQAQQIEDLLKARETLESWNLGIRIELYWVPYGWDRVELIH